MDLLGPPPVIPPRTSIDRSRRSSRRLSRAANGNQEGSKSAEESDEVISNLISSLEAIQQPANDLFNTLPIATVFGRNRAPRSIPHSPAPDQTTFADFDSGPSDDHLRPIALLPNIRQGKTRQPRTPLTLYGPRPNSSGSKTGLHASRSIDFVDIPNSPLRANHSYDQDEPLSIGTPSIDQGHSRRNSATSHSSSRYSSQVIRSSKSKEHVRIWEKRTGRIVGYGRGPLVIDDLAIVPLGERADRTTRENDGLQVDDNVVRDRGSALAALEYGSGSNASPTRSRTSELRSPSSAHSNRDSFDVSISIPQRASSIYKTGNSVKSRKKQKSRQSSREIARDELPRQRRRSRDTESSVAGTIQTGTSDPTEYGLETIEERSKRKSLLPVIGGDAPLNRQPSFQTSLRSPLTPPPETLAIPATLQAELSDDDEVAPSPSIGRSRSNAHEQNLRRPALAQIITGRLSADTRSSPRRDGFGLSPLPSPAKPRHSRSFSNPLIQHQERPPSPPLVGAERPGSRDSLDDTVEAYLRAPRLSQRIPHPTTGRMIAFSEVGDPEGHAVFCCVGMGLTRYIMAFYDDLAATLNLRLITLDRPGVGASEPIADGTGTPLGWPEDVEVVCAALGINKFSVLAHSAGAIYALATALRMPSHIRGKIHLLAPWIPPSQLETQDAMNPDGGARMMPTSQRILRVLPAPILRAANSSFMAATSSSLTSSLPKQSPRRQRRHGKDTPNTLSAGKENVPPGGASSRAKLMTLDSIGEDASNMKTQLDLTSPSTADISLSSPASIRPGASATLSPHANNTTTSTTTAANRPGSTAATVAEAEAADDAERQQLLHEEDYNLRLVNSIWSLSLKNAKPAFDLIVCLERYHPIGFRYVDITKAVVIHHGSKDPRVPVENVKWLGRAMRKCEVRILEGMDHALMANAGVMSRVLVEISREWELWRRLTGMGGSSSSLGAGSSINGGAGTAGGRSPVSPGGSTATVTVTATGMQAGGGRRRSDWSQAAASGISVSRRMESRSPVPSRSPAPSSVRRGWRAGGAGLVLGDEMRGE